MATHTLPLSHRDLNQTELDTLEALIDSAGIEAVVQGLSEICGLKAGHIAANWQDTALAKRLGDAGRGARRGLDEGNRPLGDALHSEPAHVLCPHAGSNL
jgi:hypothetical protein